MATFFRIFPLYMIQGNNYSPFTVYKVYIRYRGIFYTIPLYLEFKIIIFSIFRQVSGVKSKLIRFLDFLEIFGFLDV